MRRFKKYIGNSVNLSNIKDVDQLASFGMTCRYLPDPPEDFDEFEFVCNYHGKNNLGVMVTVEMEKIKRMFFGMISPNDPDVVRALTEIELKELLDEKGENFQRFFDFITQ